MNEHSYWSHFRCICICKPHSYQALYTKKKTILFCSLVWISCAIIDAPNWIGWSGYTFHLKEMLCVVDEKHNHVYVVVRSVAALGKNNRGINVNRTEETREKYIGQIFFSQNSHFNSVFHCRETKSVYAIICVHNGDVTGNFTSSD